MASGDRDHHISLPGVCPLSRLPYSHLCSFIQLSSTPVPFLLLSVVNSGVVAVGMLLCTEQTYPPTGAWYP